MRGRWLLRLLGSRRAASTSRNKITERLSRNRCIILHRREQLSRLTRTNLGQSTQVSGLEGLEMDKEHKYGQMAQSTLVPGKTITQAAKANLLTMMATVMKANGLGIKRMDTAPTLIIMEQNTLDSGKMMSNMALVLKSGLTGLLIRESTNLV